MILRAAFGAAAVLGHPEHGEQATAWPVQRDGACVGWLKQHRTVAEAVREGLALSTLGEADTDTVRVVRALGRSGRWLALSCARGELPGEGDDALWTLLSPWLRRVQALAVPDDPMPLAEALGRRWDAAVAVVGQAAPAPKVGWDALAAFGRVWAHRDLRPQNLRVHEGVVSVFDAGQARPDHAFSDAVVVAHAVGHQAARALDPRVADAQDAWMAARRLHALTTWAWGVRAGSTARIAAGRAAFRAIG